MSCCVLSYLGFPDSRKLKTDFSAAVWHRSEKDWTAEVMVSSTRIRIFWPKWDSGLFIFIILCEMLHYSLIRRASKEVFCRWKHVLSTGQVMKSFQDWQTWKHFHLGAHVLSTFVCLRCLITVSTIKYQTGWTNSEQFRINDTAMVVRDKI